MFKWASFHVQAFPSSISFQPLFPTSNKSMVLIIIMMKRLEGFACHFALSLSTNNIIVIASYSNDIGSVIIVSFVSSRILVHWIHSPSSDCLKAIIDNMYLYYFTRLKDKLYYAQLFTSSLVGTYNNNHFGIFNRRWWHMRPTVHAKL